MEDVTAMLDLSLAASGYDKVEVEKRLRLLSGDGPCGVGANRGEWLEKYMI